MGMGWIMMIVVGGIAGYVATRLTGTERGLAATILFGVVGAVLLNIVLAKGLGLHFGGLIGHFRGYSIS